MKKIFFIVAIIATSFTQTTFAQDKAVGSSDILSQYYAVKDALISGNASLANAKAIEFVKSATDAANLPEANRVALVKDASNIAKTKDLKKQREYFSAFSENMFALAKSTKLSSEPVYQAYCPMVKASWLSSASAIKNPYYGSSMLTCGKVVETLK
ncbi:MAG: DUF3347 domain-containing protein [Daejeonella sp.]